MYKGHKGLLGQKQLAEKMVIDENAKDYIRLTFSQDMIKEARARLCTTCRFGGQYGSCFLLPITTKGQDCPNWIAGAYLTKMGLDKLTGMF